jgi:hypothetical protein
MFYFMNVAQAESATGASGNKNIDEVYQHRDVMLNQVI